MDKRVHKRKDPTVRGLLGVLFTRYKALFRQLIKGDFRDKDSLLFSLRIDYESTFIDVWQYGRLSEPMKKKKRGLLWGSTVFYIPIWILILAALFTYIGGFVIDNSAIIGRIIAVIFFLSITLIVSYPFMQLLATHRYLYSVRREKG